MIRTLEANSRNSNIHLNSPSNSPSFSLDSKNTLNHHSEYTIRQRPLSQPCTRIETNAILTNNHRQFGTTTDDAKILSSTKNNSPSMNNSQRSDTSIRSITKYV